MMQAKTKLTIYEIACIGVCAAMLLGVQIVLAPLPNIELVSLLVICFSKAFGKRTLYIIYVFVLIEGLIYGFGLWFISYMYIWTILYFITRLMQDVDSAVVWAVIAAIFGLLFGTLTSVASFVIGGWSYGIAYIVSGLMFDVTHCIGNLVSVLLLYRPITNALSKIETSVRHSAARA